ncbi:MAG: S16 family serine protease [Candidatus Izemoplasma sp.]|nr:S16 family serine protease [Candidatus Izemoplasma sp.]
MVNQTKRKQILEWAVLSLITLLVLITSLIRVDYTFTSPGYNNNVSSFIEFDTPTPLTGSFHTTSVIHYERTTMFQYYAAKLFNHVDVNEMPPFYAYLDLEDLRVQSYLSKDDSIATSIVNAANEAGIDLDYTTYTTVYLTWSYLEPDTLEIGDHILRVNDIPIDTFDFTTVSCDDTATFDILRDKEPMTVRMSPTEIDDSCRFGISLKAFTEITEENLPYHIIETNTGGPSGGIMQALYVYSQMIETDITKGYKIAGTGTIDLAGKAGLIRGVEQKLITAIHNDIDIFFVPHLSNENTDNYVVAKALYDTLDTDLKLVPITSLDDAITYLSSLESSGSS